MPISSIATVEKSYGPTEIERKDSTRITTIKASGYNRALSDIDEKGMPLVKGVLYGSIKRQIGLKDVKIYGPSILNYTKYKCWKNIFIKYKRLIDLVEPIEELLSVYKNDNKVSIKLNFNPYTF